MPSFDNRNDVAALSNLDSEFKEFLATYKSPFSKPPDIFTLRRALAALELEGSKICADATVVECSISCPCQNGYMNEAIIYEANRKSQLGKPLIVLIHGGGFSIGTNLQMAPYAVGLAILYNAIVVSISYRLAPEYVFPSAPNDVWDALLWLSKNGTTLGADLSVGFILGGASAGGNLASVIAHRAVREKLSPPLTGVWLCIPVLLSPDTVPEKYRHLWFSRQQNFDAPFLSTTEVQAINTLYQPDLTSPDWLPLLDQTSVPSLPPTFIQVSGVDPVRDDGLLYEKVLRDHGVQTLLCVAPGVPHGHTGRVPLIQATLKTNIDTMCGFGWLLNMDKDAREVENVVVRLKMFQHSKTIEEIAAAAESINHRE